MKKKWMIYALAAMMAFPTCPIMIAAQENTEVYSVENQSLEEFYEKYGYDSVSLDNAYSIEEGFDIYSRSSDDFKSDIDALFKEKENQYTDMPSLHGAASAVIAAHEQELAEAEKAQQEAQEKAKQEAEEKAAEQQKDLDKEDEKEEVDASKQESQTNVETGVSEEKKEEQTKEELKTEAEKEEAQEKTEEKTEVKTEVKEEAKTEEKTEVKAEQKTEQKSETNSEQKTEVKEDVMTDVKKEEKTETQTAKNSEAKADVMTEVKTQSPSITSAVNETSPVVEKINVPISLYHGQDKKLEIENRGSIRVLPNYENDKAWRKSASKYNTPYLWGQCTWFAWGRFYELYGFDPGFTGDGYMCAAQLVSAHPDQFELSKTPAAGAVFSADAAHNHVGIVLDYDEETDMLLVQEGNLDGVSNPNWAVAIEDYRTIEISSSDLCKLYGNVVYAVPKEGVTFVGGVSKKTEEKKEVKKVKKASGTLRYQLMEK